MKQQKVTWFVLRREPYYHKVQYSKVPKSDVAAAVFGAVVGAFVAYMTLSSVGSGSTDLTDLMAVCWYLLLVYVILHTWVFLSKTGSRAYTLSPWLLLGLVHELFLGLLTPLWPKK